MAKFRNITPEQAEANNQYYSSDAFDFNASHVQFLDAYEFHTEPSHHAKMMTSHSKKHLQLLWNQFVACEEAQGEIMAGLHAGQTLGHQTGVEQMRGFYYYLGGVLDTYEEEVKKTELEEA